jgi:hypothetical protein
VGNDRGHGLWLLGANCDVGGGRCTGRRVGVYCGRGQQSFGGPRMTLGHGGILPCSRCLPAPWVTRLKRDGGLLNRLHFLLPTRSSSASVRAPVRALIPSFPWPVGLAACAPGCAPGGRNVATVVDAAKAAADMAHTGRKMCKSQSVLRSARAAAALHHHGASVARPQPICALRIFAQGC